MNIKPNKSNNTRPIGNNNAGANPIIQNSLQGLQRIGRTQIQERINAIVNVASKFSTLHINEIEKGLESKSLECRNFFFKTPPTFMAQLDYTQMREMRNGLESKSLECRDLFSHISPDTLIGLRGHQIGKLREILEKNNPQSPPLKKQSLPYKLKQD